MLRGDQQRALASLRERISKNTEAHEVPARPLQRPEIGPFRFFDPTDLGRPWRIDAAAKALGSLPAGVRDS